MDESLPYRISYSVSEENSHKCTRCEHPIARGYLQIAIMVQSDEDDCKYPTWYHQQCFFKTRLPPTVAAFDGFSLLRYDHQLAIKKDLGTDDMEIESKETPINKTIVPDFSIEYTKVDRDSCKGCTQQFKLGELRIMRFVAVVDENQNDEIQSGQAYWYHVVCFVRLRSKIGWLCSGDLLPGFKRLSEDDKQMIQNQIPVIKRVHRPTLDAVGENTTELEKQIRFQNEKYFEIYDYITKNVPNVDQVEILEFNGQMVSGADEQITHHLADVICFGVLKRCNNCKLGQLTFRNWIYKCTNGSGPCPWTSCGKEEKEPARYLLKIPAHLSIKYPFLALYRKVRTRALHSFKLFDDQGNDLVYGRYKKPLLFNMEFVLIGTFKKPRADIERLIRKLGGKVGIEIDDQVAAIISTKKEVRKMGKQMMEAQKHNIQVVSEKFLDKIKKPGADPILYIISKTICDWGGDPYDRIDENDVASQRDSEFYTKSLPEKITYKWKDGWAVDPECGLEEDAQVFSIVIMKRKVFYSVILGRVDIEHNKNSYYRLQLLVSNDQNLYWVFESWGRIGTSIGSKQLKHYGKLTEALDRFNSVYEDITANKFGIQTFQKQPNKFYRLDVDFEMPKKLSSTLVPTKLDASVFDLMEMLFDIDKMENMMCGCDLDLKQFPLGKISSKQIKMAMATLYSIVKLIQRNASIHELREASNKFYTLIPHTFGVGRPPVIDSIATIRAKNEMLESLLNMETIYSFLEGENGEKIHPLDSCYSKLKATIVPIAKDTDEFRLFCSIVENTQGPEDDDDREFTLEVLDIFKVVRDGEDDQFQHQLGNHQLLWHGSRQMNFASILSNGLKIAPPEAISTGYNFGKGIYFADCVSKSAVYCYVDENDADDDSNVGLMLMCEVALGNSMQMTHPFRIINIPNAIFQSVKGLGYLIPQQYQYVDGILAPFHGIVESTIPTQFLHNEYVVYNSHQVKIKYLFKLKFNYEL